MISCPDCQAENEAGAKTCHACGKDLPVAAASGELPLWLQALKPDHLKAAEEDAANDPATAESETTAPAASEPAASDQVASDQVAESESVVAESEHVAEREPVAAGSPDLAVPVAATATLVEHGGTDTLVATQPTPDVRPAAPEPPAADERTPPSAPPKSAAKATGGAASETASLINEDDLPAWLRAFSENDTANKAASADDQSWMLGTTGEGSADTVAENLAQSWQAPSRAASPRTGAAAVFAAPAEAGAKVAKVAKPERVIVAPPPVAEPAPAPAAPLVASRSATLARIGTGRPAPATRERSGMSVQRIAVIAFLVALVIFLIVLGIFIIGPSLMA